MKVILLIMIGLSFLQADYIRDVTKEVVLDTTTNMMWQDDATPASKTWLDAIDYCEASSLGGFNNWRLPNVNELYTIADKTTSSPAINPVFTNVVSSLYWSSTTYARDTTHARWVRFDFGSSNTSLKTATRYVRCVR